MKWSKVFGIWIVIVILRMFSLGISAEENVGEQELIANAPVKSDYPEADAVILLDRKKMDFTEKNYKVNRKLIIKLFNERGINKFGEFKIKYDTEREKINIITAKTINDGVETKIREQAINQVTLPELSETAVYSNIKQKTISLPSLKVGSIIVLEYIKQINQPIIPGKFWHTELFQRREPIMKKKLVVKTRNKINYNSPGIEPKIKAEKDYNLYTWIKKDSSQIKKETAMPFLEEVAEKVSFSSFNKWEGFTDWYNNQTSEQNELGGELRGKIKELTAHAESKQEKIKSLYDYVALNIRYIPLDLGVGGYKPHLPKEIYNNKYADCKDMAALLISMLKEAGIKAEPALINKKWNPDLQLVNPGMFNHVLVYLPEQNMFLDPISKVIRHNNLPLQDQGKKSLLPVSKRIAMIPVKTANFNQESIKQEVALNEDGSAAVKIDWQSKGYFSAANKSIFSQRDFEQRRDILNKIMNDNFNEARLINYNLLGIEGLSFDPRIKVSSLVVENYARQLGSILAFHPFKFSFNLNRMVESKERIYPVCLKKKMILKRKVIVKIPENYTIDYLPSDIKINNKIGNLTVNYRQQTDKVIGTLHLELNRVKVSPKDYSALKKLINRANSAMNNQIMIKN